MRPKVAALQTDCVTTLSCCTLCNTHQMLSVLSASNSNIWNITDNPKINKKHRKYVIVLSQRKSSGHHKLKRVYSKLFDRKIEVESNILPFRISKECKKYKTKIIELIANSNNKLNDILKIVTTNTKETDILSLTAPSFKNEHPPDLPEPTSQSTNKYIMTSKSKLV